MMEKLTTETQRHRGHRVLKDGLIMFIKIFKSIISIDLTYRNIRKSSYPKILPIFTDLRLLYGKNLLASA